jgi:peptide deformylase
MIEEICQAGELVLRRPARTLAPAEIRSGLVQEIIASMFETMRAAPGVGLAAPQIGLPLQLAVIEDPAEFIEKLPPEHAAEREREPVARHVIINPKLTPESSDEAKFFEGCLSVTGRLPQ